MARKRHEEDLQFTPKFDASGLIPVIVQDAKTNQVLMSAYMNRKALELTIQTGYATYFSRSRRKLWKKGEKSGHFQKVRQILVDCDQDCLLLKVCVDAGQCHTGYQSCFYRAMKTHPGGASRSMKGTKKQLKFIAKKVFNPKEIYKQ